MTEPLFKATDSNDPEMQKAYARAASSINEFISLIQLDENEITMAKLRFRDPDQSESVGKDQFLYLWLNDIVYHSEDKLLSGVFFEVPIELKEWHKAGERLGFEPEDVFDWCAIQNKHAIGGFTLRVSRNQLKTTREKQKFDEYIGIDSFSEQ